MDRDLVISLVIGGAAFGMLLNLLNRLIWGVSLFERRCKHCGNIV
jgi:hypothetical protein